MFIHQLVDILVISCWKYFWWFDLKSMFKSKNKLHSKHTYFFIMWCLYLPFNSHVTTDWLATVKNIRLISPCFVLKSTNLIVTETLISTIIIVSNCHLFQANISQNKFLNKMNSCPQNFSGSWYADEPWDSCRVQEWTSDEQSLCRWNTYIPCGSTRFQLPANVYPGGAVGDAQLVT